MKKIFLIVLFACSALACDDEVVSRIPLAQVYIRLNLDYLDRDLIGAFSYMTYIHGQKRNLSERYGYGGIVVFNKGTEFVAYDLCCPEEVQRDIRVIPNGSGQAVCSKCGAIFNLNAHGIPVSGSNYSLRQYRVTSTGKNTYNVTH